MNRESSPIIELKNVCFAYDRQIALRYITLDIFKGETVVLQGCNGCGKSTLLKLLNGLIFPEEGQFLFEGTVIDDKSMKNSTFSKRFHQKMGFVFQNADIQLFCGSVWDEIAFGPRQMGLSDTEVEKRTEDVLELLQIQHLKERAPYHLSGGEKRKTALACILSMNPQVLIMDEPLAGLDRKTQEWLLDFLLQLKAAGKTLIIATHNDDLADALADRKVIMNEQHTIEKTE